MSMGLEKYRSGAKYTQTFPIAVDSDLKTRIDNLRGRGVRVSAWVRDLIILKLPELEKQANEPLMLSGRNGSR